MSTVWINEHSEKYHEEYKKINEDVYKLEIEYSKDERVWPSFIH